MSVKSWLCVFAVTSAMFGAVGGANASVVSYDISGLDALGTAYQAHVTLDVSGGFATGGTGTITDASFGGTPQPLSLITPALPGADYGGNVIGFRSDGGGNPIGGVSIMQCRSQARAACYSRFPALRSGDRTHFSVSMEMGAVGTGRGSTVRQAVCQVNMVSRRRPLVPFPNRPHGQ